MIGIIEQTFSSCEEFEEFKDDAERPPSEGIFKRPKKIEGQALLRRISASYFFHQARNKII